MRRKINLETHAHVLWRASWEGLRAVDRGDFDRAREMRDRLDQVAKHAADIGLPSLSRVAAGSASSIDNLLIKAAAA